MQAVILAGGKGERLLPLTNGIPKPMVLINDKPYLEYQIEFLKKQGITDIVLLIGYLKEKIMDYFGDGSRFGVSICYSIEQELLGTGGALKNAEHLLRDVFFVIYGDSFLPIELSDVWELFLLFQKKSLIVVYTNEEDTSVRNNVSLDDDNAVISYEKNSPRQLDYVEAGVLMLQKEVLEMIPDNAKVSLEEEIFPKLIKKQQLIAFITDQRFYDIGTPERLEKIKEVLK